MVTVSPVESVVESQLSSGQLACPVCGDGVLSRWGYARRRRLVGDDVSVCPRRARCGSCKATHVLLPATMLSRRAYRADWIWDAFTAKAAGRGSRPIAAGLGVPASTVRGWLRRMATRLEVARRRFTTVMIRAGVDRPVPKATGSPWSDMVTAARAAAGALTDRFGLYSIIGTVTTPLVVAGVCGSRILAPVWTSTGGGGGPTRVDPAGRGWFL